MNANYNHILLALIIIWLAGSAAFAQEGGEIFLKHSNELEVVLENGRYITYVIGDVLFETETGTIRCDSAIWDKGKTIRLRGNVLYEDEEFSIKADSVLYNLRDKTADAFGQRVELWSFEDSLLAIGTQAMLDRENDSMSMEYRPTLYFNYPDTASMIEVTADRIDYSSANKKAVAVGKVEILSDDFKATAGSAVFDTGNDSLELKEQAVAFKRNSKVSGKLIAITFENNEIIRISVIDSANAEFREPLKEDTTLSDNSILKGKEIHLNFTDGQMRSVICFDQAFSWYYPAITNDSLFQENSISGDTIRFITENEELSQVQVTGGAIGKYISGPPEARESNEAGKIDTVDYKGNYIEYNLDDSLITLFGSADVKSGAVALTAYQILFNTGDRLIEAYSAQSAQDSGLFHESKFDYQPNPVPVILADGDQQVFGDYLVYSTDTEKGRIYQSKTSYDEGVYYGEKLYREQSDIFYIDDGKYTTCSAEEPHFHFRSSNLKLIKNDKLIARPLVFYLGRLPIFALPFYVLPLKKGRHSGMLPFDFGSFQQGDRYVRNIGYYWAASEYWDWQGSFDYIERQRTFTLNSRVNFGHRYVFDGYLAGSYTKVTSFDAFTATENDRTRWITSGAYSHTFSPSFSIRGNADFRSDATYFDDYSLNRDEILNRSAKSQMSFSKKFGSGTSISGSVSHIENLDLGSRTNNLPILSVSLPTVWPFGSGSKDESGKIKQHWYNNFTFRYSPSLLNFSSRNEITDTLIQNNGIDTTITVTRSRKKYAKISHNPSIGLPTLKPFKYLVLTPSFGYSETWFKINSTDQSELANIEPTTYRTYSYSAGISARTDLYGTFYPNVLGLTGLRHTITPSVTYGYRPDINRHPQVRSFAGGGSGSLKSQSISVSVRQLFQAKYGRGDIQKNIDLISFNSGFSYNFEAATRPYSNLNTSFQSSAIPKINFNGSMVHSLYKPGTDEVDFWSPRLESFRIDARFTLSGKTFIFDESSVQNFQTGFTSPDQLESLTAPLPYGSGQSGSRGWQFSAAYGYSQSGRDATFRKFSFFRFNLNFDLTPTTRVRYTHDYDIDDSKTIYNSVNVVKQIHCWTGSIFWVPIGSNKGFGFKLFVTAIPDIKIDNNHSSYLNALQR